MHCSAWMKKALQEELQPIPPVIMLQHLLADLADEATAAVEDAGKAAGESVEDAGKAAGKAVEAAKDAVEEQVKG